MLLHRCCLKIAKMAAVDVDMESGDAPSESRTEFENLFLTKWLREATDADVDELIALQEKIDDLQGDYVEKQVMQNVMEKLMQIDHEDDFHSMLSAEERIQSEYRKRRVELDTAITERRLHISKLGELIEEVQREKENIERREQTRPDFENELEVLKAEWKELQRRNAQRKAAIQMATGMMINNEEDCNRILETQTQDIQELHEQQKRLEERSIDLTTRVKQTADSIAQLEKENDTRSRDLHTKLREEESSALEHMKLWYQNLNQLLTTLTGIDITRITDDFMELSLLKSHSLRLYFDQQSTKLVRVEFLQKDIDARDLAEVAVRTNDIQFLVLEYLERVMKKGSTSSTLVPASI